MCVFLNFALCFNSPCLANLVCCLHPAATKENEEGSWAQVRLFTTPSLMGFVGIVELHSDFEW